MGACRSGCTDNPGAWTHIKHAGSSGEGQVRMLSESVDHILRKGDDENTFTFIENTKQEEKLFNNRKSAKVHIAWKDSIYFHAKLTTDLVEFPCEFLRVELLHVVSVLQRIHCHNLCTPSLPLIPEQEGMTWWSNTKNGSNGRIYGAAEDKSLIH